MPLNHTSPEVGRRFIVMQLNTVVLPAPFGPITEWMLFSSTSRSTSDSATRPPKRMVTLRQLRMALAMNSVPLGRHGVAAGIQREGFVAAVQLALARLRRP